MLSGYPSRMVQHEAVGAFDSLAARYDELFTCSAIGRAQRDAVWEVLLNTFEPESYILELNCGTGEDALFLDDNNMSLVACDASEQMIRTARQRMMAQNPEAAIRFEVLPTEYINELAPGDPFDGVLSNFSGLNCVEDLSQVAEDLARLVTPHAPVVLCLSTRYCMVEILWFLLRGEARKAFRRVPGIAVAHVDQFAVTVRYPTLCEVKGSFAPYFRLRSCTGIGITVPPSYLETRIGAYPRLLKLLQSIDRRISGLPWFRAVGDHMLLCFERVEQRTEPEMKSGMKPRIKSACC